jgi:hypothetical protein
MKIRKGKRKYAILLNQRTGFIYLTREGSKFDVMYNDHLNSFSCTFAEAKHNIKVGLNQGLMLSVRK